MPKLHITSPGALAATIELTDKLITIGRNEDNAICIPDANVSSQHGMLVRDGEDYQLHDFKSTNGTYIDGQEIMAAKLKDGARIRLGDVELRYEGAVAKAASPAIKPGAEEGLLSAPAKASSSKDRGGMAKRMKPEYSAGSLGSGPATIQPLITAKPIPPPDSKPSE